MASSRLALVTGAARGIGKAIATRLARDGMRLVCVDLDADAVKTAAAEITALGGRAEAVNLDICDRTAVAALLERLGRPVDVLVNNAGIYSDKPFMALTEDDFRRMIEVNLIGLFVISQEVLKGMQRGGRIINMASRSFLGARNMGHYGSSKAAVAGLTRTMAIEFASSGISINAIAPGLVETPILDQLSEERREALRRLQPTGELGRPEDIAATVSHLAAPDCNFTTGQILIVDGGKSLGGVWM